MELKQKFGLLSGSLQVNVEPNDVLVLTYRKLMNVNENKYLLDDIYPKYDTHKQFSLSWAITSFISLMLAIFLWWYGKSYYEPPKDGVLLFLSVMFGVAFLVAGVKAYKSRVNLINFNSHNGQRLFSIFGNKPSVSEVKIFCDELTQRLERIRYNGEVSNERMKEILTKHVDFLFENNVLDITEKNTALLKISKKSNVNIVNINDKKNA